MTEPDDDQQWLDLMAGRDAPDAHARTRKEAAWLRAAMLSYRPSAPSGAPPDPRARVDRLLTRARDAGVLATPANDEVIPDRKPGPARNWRQRWPTALAASAVLCAATVLLMPNRGGIDDADVLRGAPVQTLQVPDVQTAVSRRAEVLKTLLAEGFDAAPFERLGRPGIDVALPVPLPQRQASALKALGLAPPTGPSLQIEFSPSRSDR